MAVGQRGEFAQDFPPPVPVDFATRGQFKRRFLPRALLHTAARPKSRQRSVFGSHFSNCTFCVSFAAKTNFKPKASHAPRTLASPNP
jgi:hypothetical protein